MDALYWIEWIAVIMLLILYVAGEVIKDQPTKDKIEAVRVPFVLIGIVYILIKRAFLLF